MPRGVLIGFVSSWVLLLAGSFVWISDERPPGRGSSSNLGRAARWLYQRLFLALLGSGLAAALLVLAPYGLSRWLF